MQTYILNIRPKRQTTLPDLLLKELDLEVGDKLKAEVRDKKLVLTPQKQVTLDTLSEIQRIFSASGIPEKEIQENVRKIRKDIYTSRI